MKPPSFGILFVTVFYTNNVLAYNSDYSEEIQEDENPIAQFAYEVANIAQSRIDQMDEMFISESSTTFIPQLLIAESQGVSRLNLTSSIRWMIERSENIGGLDYHFVRDQMYWSDLSTGSIYFRPLNNKSLKSFKKRTFVERSPLIWKPRSIAVDYITDQLYVTDTIGNTVHVFDLNDSRNSVTFKPFLHNPLNIELDPNQGYMFIADDTRLMRASMDGTSSKAIVEQSVYFISAVTLDLDMQRVYWSDQSFNQIKSANYDGTQRRVVLKNELGKVYNLLGMTSITFYDSQLFIYDETWHTIVSINVSGPEQIANDSTYVVIYDWLIVKAIRLVHPSKQKHFVNPCANEQCSARQMCFISAKEGASHFLGFTCAYPDEDVSASSSTHQS
ncbi:PREDICTED: low-density lipoprotein receptor-related protein 6-like [Ceratosolen solmsi marchali]|uniref:Low-density lipoprotein receptor-related protein 6-like n=1 Tax=Ceratosolen solmsi marchali TaxID=326594 RepID=A0AAJ6YJV3_9HYME|nr:PREDICTED: low-density lipoprotein receptor-related protein 6-like [Ceratosolen solmsi marchali]